ncbi:hypothetical protein MTO96_032543 [Rhipicephalus appendiculatus]
MTVEPDCTYLIEARGATLREPDHCLHTLCVVDIMRPRRPIQRHRDEGAQRGSEERTDEHGERARRVRAVASVRALIRQSFPVIISDVDFLRALADGVHFRNEFV